MLRTPPLLAHLGLAAGLALTTAAPALAGGFKLSEYSVRDLGMADAGYAALADDPSTIWSNPAGLARLDGLQVQVGAHAIIGQGDFTNAGSVDVLGRPLGGTEENDLFNDAVIPNFYLSRRLNIGAAALCVQEAAEGELSLSTDSQVDALALEIQRSLDYFDSQIGMGVVSEIWVLAPDGMDVSDALPQLETSVNTPVRLLNPSRYHSEMQTVEMTASLALALANALTAQREVA